MSTLTELTSLHLTRPAAGAPAGVVAAWQSRHALVLEHLAAEGSPLAAQAVAALRAATGARRRP
jgi:hypothetical protein